MNELETREIITDKFVPQWSSFNEFLEWYFDMCILPKRNTDYPYVVSKCLRANIKH